MARKPRSTVVPLVGSKFPAQAGVPGGEALLSDLQSEFIDWLIDPNRAGTQKDWAEAHGITSMMLSRWKKENYFVRVWRERADRVNGGPERVQQVADALFQASLQDWRAAAKYLEWVERMSPPRRPQNENGDLRDMDDEEFKAKLAEVLKGA